jgi:NADPH-dependent 2,4-dienoyl-CoA reductase/sulfur reductase-like enzyme
LKSFVAKRIRGNKADCFSVMASQCMWRALLARRTAWVFPGTIARSVSNSGHSPNLRNASEMDLPTSELPCKAKVVICGGGAQGTAIAYNLAKRGLANDTVIIDKVSEGDFVLTSL